MVPPRLPTRAVLGLAGLGLALALVGCAPANQVVSSRGRECDTSFRVVNASSAMVERLYFSHASQGGWGNDQLGRQVLAPGQAASYRAAHTGAYDFRAVWASGKAAELRGINVCAATTITIRDSGLRAS